MVPQLNFLTLPGILSVGNLECNDRYMCTLEENSDRASFTLFWKCKNMKKSLMNFSIQARWRLVMFGSPHMEGTAQHSGFDMRVAAKTSIFSQYFLTLKF